MYTFFQKLIDQGVALVYIDDILLLSHTKAHMIELIEQLHQTRQKILKLPLRNLSTYSWPSNFLDMKLTAKQLNQFTPKWMVSINLKLLLSNLTKYSKALNSHSKRTLN